MRLPAHAPYFDAFESIAPKGRYNWCLHEACGHEYHIATGFDSIESCLADMAARGPAILADYLAKFK